MILSQPERVLGPVASLPFVAGFADDVAPHTARERQSSERDGDVRPLTDASLFAGVAKALTDPAAVTCVTGVKIADRFAEAVARHLADVQLPVVVFRAVLARIHDVDTVELIVDSKSLSMYNGIVAVSMTRGTPIPLSSDSSATFGRQLCAVTARWHSSTKILRSKPFERILPT